MSKLKHTPRPWKYVKYNDLDPIVIAGPDHIIASIPQAIDSDEEDEANAAIMAAAPEMYEALTFTRNVLRTNGKSDTPLFGMIDRLLNKIEK